MMYHNTENKPDAANFAGSEAGVIVIIFPFIYVAILLLIGLALDSARLYHTVLDLQTAADSAALSAVAARAGETDSNFNSMSTIQYVEKRVNLATSLILEERNIDTDPDAANYDFNRVANPLITNIHQTTPANDLFVQVRPSASVPTFLMYRLSQLIGRGVGSTQGDNKQDLRVVARSRITPANIVFMADLSESSRCPEIGPCDCNVENSGVGTCSNEATMYGPNVKLKYQRIKEAFEFFISALDQQRDNVALVFFNNSAWVEVPFKAGRGFVPGEFTAAFDKVFELDSQTTLPVGQYYVPRGNTNIADALLTSLHHASQSGLIERKLKMQYILLTDGAPTAMRGTVVSEVETLDALNFNLIFKKRITNAQGQMFDVTYEGPGYFTPAYHYKHTYQGAYVNRTVAPLMPKDNTGYYMINQCYEGRRHEVYDMNTHVREDIATYCSNTQAAYIFCNPELHHPGIRREVCQASHYKINFIDTIADGTYKKFYYHSAMQVAQVLRQHKGTIYTIGWGPPATADDLYGDIRDGSNVKSIFLSNLANEQDGEFARDFDYYGYRPLALRKVNVFNGLFVKESVGAFYNPRGDDHGVELRKSLELIARQINARLIEPQI